MATEAIFLKDLKDLLGFLKRLAEVERGIVQILFHSFVKYFFTLLSDTFSDLFHATGRCSLLYTTMYLYCISDSNGHCKFGFSVDPYRRLRSLQTGHSSQLTVIHSVAVKDHTRIRALEQQLHREIGLHRRVRGEWFAISDSQACALLTWFEIRYC